MIGKMIGPPLAGPTWMLEDISCSVLVTALKNVETEGFELWDDHDPDGLV